MTNKELRIVEIRLNPRKNSPRRGRLIGLSMMMILAILLAGAWIYYQHWLDNLPNTETVELDFNGNSKPIFLDGKQLETPASGSGDDLMFPLDVVQQYID